MNMNVTVVKSLEPCSKRDASLRAVEPVYNELIYASFTKAFPSSNIAPKEAVSHAESFKEHFGCVRSRSEKLIDLGIPINKIEYGPDWGPHKLEAQPTTPAKRFWKSV